MSPGHWYLPPQGSPCRHGGPDPSPRGSLFLQNCKECCQGNLSACSMRFHQSLGQVSSQVILISLCGKGHIKAQCNTGIGLGTFLRSKGQVVCIHARLNYVGPGNHTFIWEFSEAQGLGRLVQKFSETLEPKVGFEAYKLQESWDDLSAPFLSTGQEFHQHGLFSF